MSSKIILHYSKKAFVQKYLAVFIIAILVLIVSAGSIGEIYKSYESLDLEADEQRCIGVLDKTEFTINNELIYCVNYELTVKGEVTEVVDLVENLPGGDEYKYFCKSSSDAQDERTRISISNTIAQSIEDNEKCSNVNDEKCTCVQQAYLSQKANSNDILESVSTGDTGTIGQLITGEVEQQNTPIVFGYVQNLYDSIFSENSEEVEPERNYRTPDLRDTEFEETYQRLKENNLLAYLEQVAQENDVDPVVLFFIIHKESNGVPNAISVTGAAGLTQFTGGTARSPLFSEIFSQITSCCTAAEARDAMCRQVAKCNQENDDRFNPFKSIQAMVIHHKDDLRIANGNLYVAIAGYNGGTLNFDHCNERQGREESIECICSVTGLTNGNQACDYVTKISSWVDEYSFSSEGGDQGNDDLPEELNSDSDLELGEEMDSNVQEAQREEVEEQVEFDVNNPDLRDTIKESGYPLEGNDRIIYENANAVRKYGLAENLENALQKAAQEADVYVHVFSGGQVGYSAMPSGSQKCSSNNNYWCDPNGNRIRVGSRRHDFGNAADFYLTSDRNTVITHGSLTFNTFIRSAFKNGVQAGGSGYMSNGGAYMGSINKVHLDIVGTRTGGGIFWYTTESFREAANQGISDRSDTSS